MIYIIQKSSDLVVIVSLWTFFKFENSFQSDVKIGEINAIFSRFYTV